jgi:hypothetical protein
LFTPRVRAVRYPQCGAVDAQNRRDDQVGEDESNTSPKLMPPFDNAELEYEVGGCHLESHCSREVGAFAEDRSRNRDGRVGAAGVIVLLEDAEQKLGWAYYPAGSAGMAARMIVRLEIIAVIKQVYPELKEECRRLLRREWNRWGVMAPAHGLGVVVAARFLGAVTE